MVFNPLFLNAYTTTDSAESSKTSKFANQNYLFSDIIKVHFDKPADINQLLMKGVTLPDNKLSPELLPSASIELSAAEIKDVKQILQNIFETLTGNKKLPDDKTFADKNSTAASNETEIVSGEVVLTLLNQLEQLTKSSGGTSQISEINSVEFSKELEKLKAIIASSENENGCRVVVQLENKEYTLNIQPIINSKKLVNQELAKIEELNKSPESISLTLSNPNLLSDSKINLPENLCEAPTTELNSTVVKNDETLLNVVPVSDEENETGKIALANKSDEQKPSTNAKQQNITESNFANSTGTSSNTAKVAEDENKVSSSPKVQSVDRVEIKNDTEGNRKSFVDDKINMSENNAEGVTEAFKNLSSATNNLFAASQPRAAGNQGNIKNFEIETTDVKSVDAVDQKEIKGAAKVEVEKIFSSVKPEDVNVKSSKQVDSKEINQAPKIEDIKNITSVKPEDVKVELSMHVDSKEINQAAKIEDIKNITSAKLEAVKVESSQLVDAKEIKQTAHVEEKTSGRIITAEEYQKVEIKTNHGSSITEAQTTKDFATEKISAGTVEPGIKTSVENSSTDKYNEKEVKRVINNQQAAEVKKAAPQLFKIIVDAKQIEHKGKDTAEIKIDIFTQQDENIKDVKNFLADAKSLNNYEALKLTKPQLVSRTHVSNILSGQKSFESGYLKAIYTSSTYKNSAEFEPLNLNTTAEKISFTQHVVTDSNKVLQPEVDTKFNMPVETINPDEVFIKASANNNEIKNQSSDNKSAKTDAAKLDFIEEIDVRTKSEVKDSETPGEKFVSKSTVVDREEKQNIYQSEKRNIVEARTVNKTNGSDEKNLYRANKNSETTPTAEEKAAGKDAILSKLDELKTAAKVLGKHETANNIEVKNVLQNKNIGEAEDIKTSAAKDAQKPAQTSAGIKQTELEQKAVDIFTAEKLPLNVKANGKGINAKQMLNDSDEINFNADKEQASLKNENEAKVKVNDQKADAPIINKEESVTSKKETVIQPEKEIKEIKLNSNNIVKEVTAVPRENTAQGNANSDKAANTVANEKGEEKVSPETDTKSSGNDLSSNDSKLNSYHNTETNKTTVTAEKTTFASHLNETVKTIKAAEVVKEITSFIKQGDKTSMTFKITPEHLGKVKVMLEVTENVVKANIEVESESVRQVVQNNIDVLKQSFIQSGIAVASVNINLAGQDQKSNRTYDPKKKIDTGDGDSKAVKKKGIDKKIRNLGYNTYEFLA